MCILVVEDDPLIRMILVEELLDAGYDVKEAATGDEAYELLAYINPALSLLVTDIHMPGVHDGIALGAHVRACLPDVPIIYTTGRPDALARVRHIDSNQYLVCKPYAPNDIIDRAKHLLGR